MKNKMMVWICVGLVGLSGCATTKKVEMEISGCPQYFRDNVGEAKILPIWSAIIPIMGGPVGWLNKDGSYTLTAIADRKVRLHEAFHSFDFNSYHRDRDAHDAFVRDWGGIPRQNIVVYLAAAAVPIIDKIPIPGYVSIYGLSNGVEDAAETFSFGAQGKSRNDKELMRKWRVVDRYARGHYVQYPGVPILQNETEIQPGIYEAGLIGWAQ